MTSEEAQKVEGALRNRRRMFFCPVMNATLPRCECVERQFRKPHKRPMGYVSFNTPFDDYCRSGECELGLKNRGRCHPTEEART